MNIKNITLKDLFCHSFVLTLSEHRLQVFRQRFARYFGECSNLIRPFQGYKMSGLIARTNIMIGHTAIVRMAKAMDWPFVCIFEDDAFPCRDAEARMSKLMEDTSTLPPDTRILWTGWCQIKGRLEPVEGSQDLCRLQGRCAGAQAWIIFKDGYDIFLNEHDCAGVHIDLNCSTCPGLYLVRDSLFCQADMERSGHGHLGYSGGGIWSSESPPAGFDRDEACDKSFIDKFSIYADGLKSILNIFGDFMPKSDKCLIIGSNPSIMTVNKQQFVDNFDGEVIRVNNMPDPRFMSNYGSRMDRMITSRWYQTNIRMANIDGNIKYVMGTDDIQRCSDIYNIGRPRLSDGGVAIMLALSVYRQVYILGFGDAGAIEVGTYRSIHNNRKDNMDSSSWLHDINAEHRFFHMLASTDINGTRRIVEVEKLGGD
jgi:hypothetical protein